MRAIPVAPDGSHDLAGMAAASSAAGLAFICNPNNPTGGINASSAVVEFVKAFRAASPAGYILMDEAYDDYVTDTSYATAVPIAMTDPRVDRVADLLQGPWHGRAARRLRRRASRRAQRDPREVERRHALGGQRRWRGPRLVRGSEHLARQRTLNRDARTYTRKAFESAGYKVLPSEGNFIMVDVRREASVYQQMCREVGVAIARPFPPMTTYARITIGTMDEMKKALPLIIPLLAAPARTLSPAASGATGAGDAGPFLDELSC